MKNIYLTDKIPERLLVGGLFYQETLLVDFDARFLKQLFTSKFHSEIFIRNITINRYDTDLLEFSMSLSGR